MKTRPPMNWPTSMNSGRMSNSLSTKSKHISAAPSSCCAAKRRKASSRKSMVICSPISPYAASCTKPPLRWTSIRTGCHSSIPFELFAESFKGSNFFPRRRRAKLHREIVDEIAQDILPPRRLRMNPRVVKRKMSGYALKRPCHRNTPQPTKCIHQAIEVIM